MIVVLLVGALLAIFGAAGATDFRGFTAWYARNIGGQLPIRSYTQEDPDGLRYHRRLFAAFAIFGVFLVVAAAVKWSQ